MVIEAADLAGLCGDEDLGLPAGVAFPEPVICDPRLAAGFVALHTALEAPANRLEHDERLAEWLRALTEHSPAARPHQSPLSPRDDKAFRLARDYLADQPERNISLDELATAAGTGRHRLIRLFRQRTGLPPHALQLAHRIRTARRLLEAGRTPAQAATAAGFTDQSHLHRHFRRSLGVTPAEYQRRFLQPGQR
jgi:transcriptional regulator GlxA family with amidase domain